ncbi:8-oxo-dGTP diphosphatase [soil metagenome]
MPYTPILATLGYVFSPDRRRVLMVHRTARPEDTHLGKYNGLGGKLEAGEDIVAGMCRELHEEAGIVPVDIHLAGTVSWPGFGKQGEDWFGFLFRILSYTGTPPAANVEGTLEWIPVEKVLQLPLWDGDRHFLPMILDLASPPFHGVMPYANGLPLDWRFSRLLTV